MGGKLYIAAAGSGKTTFLVRTALTIQNQKVLITTFTEANEREIIKKIIEINGCIPPNITVQTWFSFLLQHGVRPYQSTIWEQHITGLLLVNTKSGQKGCYKGRPIYFGEHEIPQYYFSCKMQIYSDKIAKFVCRANEKTNGRVVDRIRRIYPNILIDEVQDMAGYDLELIKYLLGSDSKLIMVGDPRQVTYHTHDEAKYSKYSDGQIEDFLTRECNGLSIEIDKTTLNVSYRNRKEICELANKVYLEYPPCAHLDHAPTEHDGVFFVDPNDVDVYLKRYNAVQLRDKRTVSVNTDYPAFNFGESKGLTFDRVLIYPTKEMRLWMLDHGHALKPQTRSKLYVALTRARYSVAIVYPKARQLTIPEIAAFGND